MTVSTEPSTMAWLWPASNATFSMSIVSKSFLVNSRPLCTRTQRVGRRRPERRGRSPRARSPTSTSPLACSLPARSLPTGAAASCAGRNRADVDRLDDVDVARRVVRLASRTSPRPSTSPRLLAACRARAPCVFSIVALSLTRSIVAVDLGEREVQRLLLRDERDVEVEVRGGRASTFGSAMNGPLSVIVPPRLSPPIFDLMHVCSVGPRFLTSSARFHAPSYGRSQ